MPAVAEAANRFDQPRQVGRVQPRRRFVEHVQHAGEVRPERRGEGDALRFAAAERSQRAFDRQVADADALQIVQPRRHLIDQQLSDLSVATRSSINPRSQASASLTRIAMTSAMFQPPIRTASASGFSRAPAQAGQG